MAPALPRGGGRRRLTSIRNPTRSPSVVSTILAGPLAPTPPPTQPITAQEKNRSALSLRYHCPQCSRDDEDVRLSDDGGLVICGNCGTIISDNPQLQSEVVFGESSNGAAVVQGSTLAEGQRRTHLQLGHMHADAPEKDDRIAQATKLGTEEIKRLTLRLGVSVSERIIHRANTLYNLTKIHAFQRPLSENAAISIYAAAREEKGNQILLIDLAELIDVNVFVLGSAYKKFLDKLGLTERYLGTGDQAFQRMVEPEPLIKRFARRLEFGKDTDKVSSDACSILARMGRDWMVTGRQPMGLVGACLIIAARMNNYRRTLREVVYVVRAGEMTILKRLNEFSTTAAARLTVDQFRQLRDDETLNSTIKEALPPSLTQLRKRRKTKHESPTEPAVSKETSFNPSNITEMSLDPELLDAESSRRDADGFVIPPLPPTISTTQGAPPSPFSTIDPPGSNDDTEEDYPRPKRGRPKKLPLPEVSPTADDLEAEATLEANIGSHVQEIEANPSIAAERGEGWYRAKALADAARAQERQQSKWKLVDLDSLGEELGDDEFEDDPEVKYCKLTEREVEVKEKIWVTHNHDWLRAQQERLLQEQLQQAQGKKRRVGPRKKMARRGDGSILGSSPVGSAAEASSLMMGARSKRHVYSKHIDYDKLKRIYDEDPDSSSVGSPTPSRRSSMAPSSRAGSRALSVTPIPDSSKKKGRRVSFSPDVRSESAPSPSVADFVMREESTAVAGAKRPPPRELPLPRPVEASIEDQDDDDDDDDEDLPGFGEGDYEEEYVNPEDADEDYLDQAAEYGVDMG